MLYVIINYELGHSFLETDKGEEYVRSLFPDGDEIIALEPEAQVILGAHQGFESLEETR